MFDWNDAPDTRDTRPLYGCACGQVTLTPTDACDACEKARKAPQGEQVQMFAPVAAAMPNQIMGRWDPYQ